MNNIEIYWNEEEFEYYTDIKIDNQILHMAFEEYDSNLDTVYFNIYMTLYSKRKDIHYEYPYLLKPNLSTNAVYISRSLFFKYFNKSLLLPIFFKRPLFE